MAVRNRHTRQSTNYIIRVINDIRYYIQPDTYLRKSIVYEVERKIKENKIVIPPEFKQHNKTILVICKGGNDCNFSLL
jgi:hypothetical protein